MLFTFLVITYMHERYILQTLESIKYQIENFGQDMKFQLILADDGSIDKTVKYVEFWLEENRNLFTVIDVVTFKENRGASLNIDRAYDLIKGDEYKFIEGDDLFSCYNIFETVKALKNYDLICCTYLPFIDNVINEDKSKYMVPGKRSVYSKKQISFLSKVTCPIGGAAVFERRELLTSSVRDLMLNFKLVGDRPKIYKYFVDNNDLEYRFESKPLILYRNSETSISQNKGSRNNKIHDKDILLLWKIINKKTNNIMIRYINFCNSIQLRGKSKVSLYIKYINPLIYYNKYLQVINRKKINKTIQYLVSEIEPNQKYLNMIVESAQSYINEFNKCTI